MPSVDSDRPLSSTIGVGANSTSYSFWRLKSSPSPYVTFFSFSKNSYWVAYLSILEFSLPNSASEGCMYNYPPSVNSWRSDSRPLLIPSAEPFNSDLFKNSTAVSDLFLSKSSVYPATGFSLLSHYSCVPASNFSAELTLALNASSGLKYSWSVPAAETSPEFASR